MSSTTLRLTAARHTERSRSACVAFALNLSSINISNLLSLRETPYVVLLHHQLQ